MRLTDSAKKKRGYYYVGKIKYYWRECDFCGIMYQGQGARFCNKTCMRKASPLIMSGEKNPSWIKGKPTCVDCQTQLSNYTNKRCRGCWDIFHRGKNAYQYKLDRSTLARKQERNDGAYKEWRLAVYKRDGFKCQVADETCYGRIEAHHILGWTEHEKLRYEVNNGITLCHNHHPRKRKDELVLSPYFQSLVMNKVK